MIVYWSILAYTCIIAMFGCSLKRRQLVNTNDIDDIFKQQKSISLFFALLSMVLLVYFVGQRTDYADTLAYIYKFRMLSSDVTLLKQRWIDREDNVLFWTIAILFKKFISNDPNAWLTFLAIFQIGAIVKLYYKYSSNFAFSIYLFIASGSIASWLMNGIRQFTAICLVLYFFDFVVERKLIPFLIVIAVAYYIHPTAVFWIPIYFIVKFKPFSWQIWVCVIATLFVVFFINTFTDLLNDSLEGTRYEGQDITAIDDGANPIRVLIYAIPPAIALWKRKTLESYNNKFIDVSINLATVCVGISLLAVFTSGILVGRVPGYFEMTNYILLPWLLKYVFDNKSRIFVTIACILGYFAYFYFIMVIQGSGIYISSVLDMYLY